MTRLLYVVNIARFFVSHRLPLALAARAEGYEVHIATAEEDAEQVARIREAGFPFHPLPLSQHGTNPLAELRALAALAALYRQLKPHLVHHVSIKPVLYGGLAARAVGVPAVVGAMSGLGYVFIGDGFKPRLLRLLAQFPLRWALGGARSCMIFQNEEDRARFVAMGLIPMARTALIRGSGVDVARFAPQPEPPGLPMVLFAGRLMWKKGLGLFAQAAEQLRGRARFVVVGYAEPTSPDNVPIAQLEAWARDGLIEWWGKREDMPSVFAASHLVCLPSSYGEGVPKVLIEAAACGRPIVTTDTPGCRDIARHGDNGLLVPKDDLPALVSALDRLISDPALRQRMGARGRDIAMAEFSLERVARETLALYRALLGHGQAPH